MRPQLSLSFLSAILTLITVFPLFAQDSDKPVTKVSSYAPAKAAEAQLKYFVDKIGRDLDDKEEYGEAEQNRVSLDGSTVAVLALTLGMHDQETNIGPAATKLIEAANELVDNVDDFDTAVAAHGKLQAILDAPTKGGSVAWDDPVADLMLLMQQVPIVNNGLRRGVDDKRRFARNAKKTADRAVTLAAIAQVSMMDLNYCSDEDDEKAWRQICADMRDACADVYKALMDKDQDKAKAANARVVESCDACHHRFRD